MYGDGPAAYESTVGIFMAAFVDALCAAVQLRPGESVLDVACGTGFVTRRLPMLVGPTGRVAGADVNPAMLARAEQSCPPGIDWVIGAAADMPLPDNEFDAVLCQQGAQFFPDLVAAMTEARRVGRPGLRFAATVWAPKELSPYLEAQFNRWPPKSARSRSPHYEPAFRKMVNACSQTALDRRGSSRFPCPRSWLTCCCRRLRTTTRARYWPRRGVSHSRRSRLGPRNGWSSTPWICWRRIDRRTVGTSYRSPRTCC